MMTPLMNEAEWDALPTKADVSRQSLDQLSLELDPDRLTRKQMMAEIMEAMALPKAPSIPDAREPLPGYPDQLSAGGRVMRGNLHSSQSGRRG